MSLAILLFSAVLLGTDNPVPVEAAPTQSVSTTSPNPRVAIETSLGRIVVELDPAKAPKTVENFLAYVKAGFYDGTTFHRVMPDFMIQGGGFTADMQQKQTRPPIVNEADNGLKNVRGALSMARTPDPNSATSQFFICQVDRPDLNHTGKNPQGWGYAVFGKVLEGIEVVDKIASVKTGNRAVPMTPVMIQKATLLP